MVIDSDDLHVYVNIDSKYVQIGSYVYKVFHNIKLILNEDLVDKILVNIAQYNDIKKYIINDTVTIRSFLIKSIKINHITMILRSPNSYSITLDNTLR